MSDIKEKLEKAVEDILEKALPDIECIRKIRYEAKCERNLYRKEKKWKRLILQGFRRP